MLFKTQTQSQTGTKLAEPRHMECKLTIAIHDESSSARKGIMTERKNRAKRRNNKTEQYKLIK